MTWVPISVINAWLTICKLVTSDEITIKAKVAYWGYFFLYRLLIKSRRH